jgi:predicted dehydrogenase
MTRTQPPAVVLVGTSGYGSRHLGDLLRWHAAGLVDLAALVDVAFTADTRRQVSAAGADPMWANSLREALGHRAFDAAVVATPPDTHFTIAETVLRNGIGLYLEKPPVPLLQQLDILAGMAPVQRVEVGFQQARATVEAIEAVLAAGTVGDVSRVVASGCLARPDTYYTRNSWAGTWFAHGRPVLDGPLFNPLAHVVHTALILAARMDPGWVPETLEAELYSVRAIAGDDTGALRIRSRSGPEVVAVGTSAADEVREPSVTVHGSRGYVTVRHRDARGFVEVDGVRRGLPARRSPEPALFEALRKPDDPPDELIDLAAVRPFVTVVNAAVEVIGTPIRVVDRQRVVHRGEDLVRVLPGISALVARVAGTGRLFGELGAPWARPAGSLNLSGYRGLSHPELATECVPAPLTRTRGAEA